MPSKEETETGKNKVTSAYAVKRSYGYDRTGNLIHSTDQRTGTTHFEYDKLGRITQAGNERFAFDPAHNILSDGLNTVTDNRLKTYNGTSYYYDELGNLIHRELADGEVQNYFYDLHDQLVKAEIFKKDGTKETWAYTYDALGRRIGKGRLKEKGNAAPLSDGLRDNTCLKAENSKDIIDSEITFLWDGSHLLQEHNSDGLYTYIYTDQDSYEPLAQVRDWTTEDGESRQQTHYFHCDQIGIPREMTDKDGNLLWFGNYTGWGRLKEETKVTDSAYQPFRLQNQYADSETGLHYNFFRYYEPECGRFINQDPIGLWGGNNFYLYGLNSSVWIDFLGLTGARVTWTGPNVPGGTITGLSTGEGGKGITHLVVQEAYDNVPIDKRSDPRMHGRCAEAEALSKGAEKANVTNMEELRKLAKNSVSTANRNDKKGKPMRACPSCSHVLKNLGIRDGNGG